MSCYSTPTETQYATITSSTISSSFSDRVTSAKPTLTTIQSCVTTNVGLLSLSNCEEIVTTVGGGESTVQVPVAITVKSIQTIPTSTLFGTTCSNGHSQSSSSTIASASSTSVSSSSSSTSPGSSSESLGSTSATSEAASNPTVYTTVIYESASTTLPGGTVVETQVTSTETVSNMAATSSSGGAHSASNNTSSGGSTSNDTPAIVGAIVGGIVALILLAVLFAYFLRGKKRTAAEKEEDTMFDQIVHDRNVREKRANIDAEVRPFTSGLSNRQGNPAAMSRPSLDTLHPSSLPTIRTEIPSPALPFDPFHGHFSNTTQPPSAVDTDSTVRPYSPPHGPVPRQHHDAQRAHLHVMNRLTDASLAPPPVPVKNFEVNHHPHGQESSPKYRSWLPPLPNSTSGPSTNRMPEPPHQLNNPIVSQGAGLSMENLASRPMGKAAASFAADRVELPLPPPPAYSE